jgi:hypothetical protein
MDFMTIPDLVAYARLHKLAVVSTIGSRGEPQGALVGIGATDELDIVFDTVTTSRKHSNLVDDPRVAVTFDGPGEKTLQLEGLAVSLSTTGAADAEYREAYYLAWPDGRDRLLWRNIVYWRVSPRWARYSDYDRGPLIQEFHW